ncbi:unnamed protein product [Hydatigera taeniaeformis]|uniref:Uncharacterized protein n=1 Tax=Hydatigena taeniaeformis TaxID=6205 RepID=A0A0R3X983_HYDTA|nr:unnamed protein product [Hydatigera taeniaeformis]
MNGLTTVVLVWWWWWRRRVVLHEEVEALALVLHHAGMSWSVSRPSYLVASYAAPLWSVVHHQCLQVEDVEGVKGERGEVMMGVVVVEEEEGQEEGGEEEEEEEEGEC